MRILIARLVSLCCLALTIASALTLGSCKDKFATEVDTIRDTTRGKDSIIYRDSIVYRDSVIHRDSVIYRDSIVYRDSITHDTILVPDVNVWILRNSGTSENLVSGVFSGSLGYLGGSNGVMVRTNDAGDNWQLKASAPIFNSSFGPGAVYGLALTGLINTLFAAGDQRVIVRSSDGANSWASINTGAIPGTDLIRSIYFVDSVIGFVGTSEAFAAHSGSIGKTTDGGQTWVTTNTTLGGIYSLYFNGANGVALGRYGVCYWTDDRGNTWNTGSSDRPDAIIFQATFTGTTTGFAAASEITSSATGYILKTTDGGHTWSTIMTVPYGLQGLASNGNGKITAVGLGGHVVESIDGGVSWNISAVGSNRWRYANYVTPTRLVIAGANGQIATRDK
jgi:photosystem II stability/assembly factor-like uncharacterized protein